MINRVRECGVKNVVPFFNDILKEINYNLLMRMHPNLESMK